MSYVRQIKIVKKNENDNFALISDKLNMLYITLHVFTQLHLIIISNKYILGNLHNPRIASANLGGY